MGRLLLFLALALVGCSDAPTSTRPPAQEVAAPAAVAGPFEVLGSVESVAEDGSRASIAHEDVPDYMPAMTMPFFADAPGQLEGIAAGDRVRLRFERRGDGKHYLLAISPAD